MTRTPEIAGRPSWARDEPLEVQRLIVEHRLTQKTVRTLREFTGDGADVTASRRMPHPVARALRERQLGNLSSTYTPGALMRGHPDASFELNAAGRSLANALAVTSAGDHQREASASYRNEHGARRSGTSETAHAR